VRLLIAGGGTGGHLFPGIALAQEAMARDPRGAVLFVGTAQGLEGRLIPKAGFPLRLIRASGIKGLGLRGAAKALVVIPRGVWQSIGILREFRPDVVVGVGGYASGPVVLAAAMMRLPRAVIEPNAIPGITNRLLGRMVREIYVAWEETAARFPAGRAIVTGNPIRREMTALTPRAREAGAPFSVLVFGGSQGARRINQTVAASLDALGEDARTMAFAHQTGLADLGMVQAAYAKRGLRAEVAPFFDDMASRYADADLVICRAGATTVAELSAAGKASILIPFPHAADDHQMANARVLERAGGARLIPERDLSPEGLASAIRDVARTPGLATDMGARARAAGTPGAAAAILDRLARLAEGR
jgi:UDP-N-acetylglucosamine--N-acetylmuramyl-(pentapeptide) pyrophosphoryl-undecaprenol N-acetylglucosamine transferase